MILYFAYWRGEQIQFLKKVNKEQDFKIHYISFVCKERCLDFGLGCVNFCSLTATDLNTYAELTPSRPDKLSGDDSVTLNQNLWTKSYDVANMNWLLWQNVCMVT